MADLDYGMAGMSLEIGARLMRANGRKTWLIVLYAALVAVNAFWLGQELLSGDPVWWKVALRLLGVVVFSFAFHSETKKPKADPVGR